MLSWDEPQFARPQERPVNTDRQVASLPRTPPGNPRQPAVPPCQSSVFDQDVAIAPVEAQRMRPQLPRPLARHRHAVLLAQRVARVRRRRRQRSARAGGGQAHHQRRHRRQPAGAVQVQVGLGQVPRRLRQPLDAAGSQHEPRHRALEEPERPDRRRAPPGQAQPRLLRHRRFARRQQHRARHLPPHHRARVPPVPAAPGVRGGDPHPRLPVHRRDRWAWTKARSSTRTTRSSRSATRTSS